jgi:hypothetical protein
MRNAFHSRQKRLTIKLNQSNSSLSLNSSSSSLVAQSDNDVPSLPTARMALNDDLGRSSNRYLETSLPDKLPGTEMEQDETVVDYPPDSNDPKSILDVTKICDAATESTATTLPSAKSDTTRITESDSTYECDEVHKSAEDYHIPAIIECPAIALDGDVGIASNGCATVIGFQSIDDNLLESALHSISAVDSVNDQCVNDHSDPFYADLSTTEGWALNDRNEDDTVILDAPFESTTHVSAVITDASAPIEPVGSLDDNHVASSSATQALANDVGGNISDQNRHCSSVSIHLDHISVVVDIDSNAKAPTTESYNNITENVMAEMESLPLMQTITVNYLDHELHQDVNDEPNPPFDS